MSATESTILLATDFSEPAEAALEAAIELAHRYGAALEIVHVYSFPTPIAAPYDIALPASYMRDVKRLAEERIDELAQRARVAGARVATHVVAQPTVDGITEVARAVDADTIVIGTHGHTGLKHALLGSVAERVVRHAPCNVLVARSRPPASLAIDSAVG